MRAKLRDLRVRTRPSHGRAAKDFATVMAYTLTRRIRLRLDGSDADEEEDVEDPLVAVPHEDVAVILKHATSASSPTSGGRTRPEPEPPPELDPKEASVIGHLPQAARRWEELSRSAFRAAAHGPVSIDSQQTEPSQYRKGPRRPEGRRKGRGGNRLKSQLLSGTKYAA